MSVRVLTQGAGAGGAAASIIVRGLDEASIVTAKMGEKNVAGELVPYFVHTPIETPVSGGVASASSMYSSSYPAINSFNGGQWAGGSGSVFWLKYEFPRPVVIESIYFKSDSDSRRTIKGFQFQGSNDDSVWDTLYTTTTSYGSGAACSADIPNEKAYKYYRIYMPQSGDINNSPALNATKFYGFEVVESSCFQITPISKYGTWAVTATNGEDIKQQDVLVDAAVEYEIEMNYEPNYLMLYDFGNECEEITGGWVTNGYSGDGWPITAATKNADNILTAGPSSPNTVRNCLGTDNSVSVKGYNGIFAYAKNVGRDNGGDYPTLRMYIGSKTESMNSCGFSESGTQWIYTNYISLTASSHPQKEWWESISELPDVNMYFQVMATYRSERRANWYAVFITKEDNWRRLCEIAGVPKASSSENLASTAGYVTAILANEDAVRFMVSNCTGDFMAHAIQSSAFLTAYNASPYKSIIDANYHWAKFLAMVK